MHPRPPSAKMNPSAPSTPINSTRNTNHSHLFTIQLAKLRELLHIQNNTSFLLHRPTYLTFPSPVEHVFARFPPSPSSETTKQTVEFLTRGNDTFQTFRRAGGYPRARQQFELERNPRGYRRLLRVQYQVESVGVQGLLAAQRESKQPTIYASFDIERRWNVSG